jgi:hypothetical protein
MKPLEPPDHKHLEAAQGWPELGNHLEANEELDHISLTELCLRSPTGSFYAAIYEARIGDLEMARNWLDAAFANCASEEERKPLKLRILNEPDLKLLWDSLPGP